jgi:hypothetical protein
MHMVCPGSRVPSVQGEIPLLGLDLVLPFLIDNDGLSGLKRVTMNHLFDSGRHAIGCFFTFEKEGKLLEGLVGSLGEEEEDEDAFECEPAAVGDEIAP